MKKHSLRCLLTPCPCRFVCRILMPCLIGTHNRSVTNKLSDFYLYCPYLLKFCKSLLRLTFHGNSPNGKEISWRDSLRYENVKFFRKLILSRRWSMAC